MNFHALSRDIVANILSLSKITQAINRHKDKLLIVTFHRVLPEDERDQYPYPGLVVTPEELRWFLNYFQNHYTCGHLSEMHSRYSKGDRPEKPLLAVTFDDGQLDNYRYAKPVLDEFNIKASFFIPVKHVEEAIPIWHDYLGFAILNGTKTTKDKKLLQGLLVEYDIDVEGDRWIGAIAKEAKRMTQDERYTFVNKINAINDYNIPEWAKLMEWKQIRELAEEGHEIGSHTMTHTLLPQCRASDLEFELTESKNILEQRVNQAINSFCYPNGDHNQHTIDEVQQAGYLRAVTTCWGAVLSSDNVYSLKRCDMDAYRVRSSTKQLSEKILALRLSGLHPGL